MIFYFTATGNSQYAAEEIAAATGDRLVSIGQALRDGAFEYDIAGDAYLGFVIPTFAWTVPGAVALFIEKLNLAGYKGQYVYGVFTCGESSGSEAAALKVLLERKSVQLNAAFDLVMPDNFIVWSDVPSPSRLERMLQSADKALDSIIHDIKERKPSQIDQSTPENLSMPLSELSTAKNTSKLYADVKCTACGLCMSVCPMRCIKPDEEGHPLWEGSCTMCLACLHRCPVKAIQHGQDTQKKGRYVNPRIHFS